MSVVYNCQVFVSSSVLRLLDYIVSWQAWYVWHVLLQHFLKLSLATVYSPLPTIIFQHMLTKWWGSSNAYSFCKFLSSFYILSIDLPNIDTQRFITSPTFNYYFVYIKYDRVFTLKCFLFHVSLSDTNTKKNIIRHKKQVILFSQLYSKRFVSTWHSLIVQTDSRRALLNEVATNQMQVL